jgi:hypothetical protein
MRIIRAATSAPIALNPIWIVRMRAAKPVSMWFR